MFVLFQVSYNSKVSSDEVLEFELRKHILPTVY